LKKDEEMKMKKVFAILLVLAVVAGCAFAENATETHSITVNTVVAEKLPTFQLVFNATGTVANDVVTTVEGGVKVTTNTDRIAYDETTAATRDADRSDAYVGFDLGISGNHNATFDVYIVKSLVSAATDTSAEVGYYARTKNSYTLTFGGGVFDDLKASGDDAADITPSIVASEGSVVTGISSIDATNEVVTVAFSGQAVKASTKVASAVYTWEGNPLLDMGTYDTDIILTVTQQ
jgi:hypothetical protein